MIFLSGLLFLASLFQLVWGLIKVLQSGPLIDFTAFYTNTSLFLTGGNPYGHPYSFNYPPALLLIFSPLAIFPETKSQAIFTLLSFIALFVSSMIILRLFNKSWSLFFFITAVTLQSFPVKFTLAMGQVNLFVLSFAVLAFNFDQKNRPKLAGIFWAISSILKITPLTLGFYFLVRRRYKALTWGAVIFILSNFFLILSRGWTSSYFLTAVPNFFLKLNNAGSLYDQSLRAFFIRLGYDNTSLILSIFSTGVIIFLAVIQYLSQKSFLRRQESISLKQWIPGPFDKTQGKQARDDKRLLDLNFFSLILTITVIGNSYAWQHHFVFLIPGFIAETIYLLGLIKKTSPLSSPLLLGESKGKVLVKGFLLLTSFLLVSYHIPDPLNPPTNNPFLISHSLIGAIILIVLLLSQKSSSLKARPLAWNTH